jgi:hypothetical protein
VVFVGVPALFLSVIDFFAYRESGVSRRPNMRVQRTRVLLPAVARRSPLTRGPLGGRRAL